MKDKTKISKQDATIIQRFKLELALMSKLEQEGHSYECAIMQVWGEPGYEVTPVKGKPCSCKKKR